MFSLCSYYTSIIEHKQNELGCKHCLPSVSVVDCVWNVMAHAQKPDFVFRRNRRVHVNRRGRQFSRLLAAEVCASALVMLDTPRSEIMWEYWLPTPFAIFPFTSPPVRHHVPSGFKRTLAGNCIAFEDLRGCEVMLCYWVTGSWCFEGNVFTWNVSNH
jgi:hypothetical protein